MNATLAIISGEQLLNALFYIIIWAVIFALLWWGLGKMKLDEPWNKVSTILLVLLTVVVIVNILLGLVGHQIVRW